MAKIRSNRVQHSRHQTLSAPDEVERRGKDAAARWLERKEKELADKRRRNTYRLWRKAGRQFASIGKRHDSIPRLPRRTWASGADSIYADRRIGPESKCHQQEERNAAGCLQDQTGCRRWGSPDILQSGICRPGREALQVWRDRRAIGRFLRCFHHDGVFAVPFGAPRWSI